MVRDRQTQSEVIQLLAVGTEPQQSSTEVSALWLCDMHNPEQGLVVVTVHYVSACNNNKGPTCAS